MRQRLPEPQTGACRRRLAVAGVVSLACSGLFAQVPASTASVSGEVVDAITGAPIEGAFVTLIEPGSSSSVAYRTDRQGQFAIKNVAADTYELHASTLAGRGAYGHARARSRPRSFVVAAGARLANMRVPFWRFAEIGGTVTDGHGRPLPFVKVELQRHAALVNPDVEGRPDETYTDDRGRYSFTALMPDQFAVLVPAAIATEPEFDPSMGWADPPPKEVSFGLRVPDGPDDGRGPLGFISTYAPDTADSRRAEIVTVQAGAIVTGVNVRVLAVPASTIRGVISTPARCGCLVTLMDHRRDPADAIVAMTYSWTGAFAFFHVPAGNYDVVVRSVTPEFHFFSTDLRGGFAIVPIALAPGASRDLTITLEPGVAIRGRVVFEGRDAPSLRTLAVLLMLRGAPLMIVSRIDASLRFSWPGVAPGTYRLSGDLQAPWSLARVTADGRDISPPELVIGREGIRDLVLTFDTAGASVAGRIAWPLNDGAEASAVIFPVNENAWSVRQSEGVVSIAHEYVRVGESYHFAALRPAEYFIAAIEPDLLDQFPLPAFLRVLSRKASRVTLGPAAQRSLNLTVVKP